MKGLGPQMGVTDGGHSRVSGGQYCNLGLPIPGPVLSFPFLFSSDTEINGQFIFLSSNLTLNIATVTVSQETVSCVWLCMSVSSPFTHTLRPALAKNKPNENQTIERTMNVSIFIVPQIASCSCKHFISLVSQDIPCETVWPGIITHFFQGKNLGLKAIKVTWSGSHSEAVMRWHGNQISYFQIQHH